MLAFSVRDSRMYCIAQHSWKPRTYAAATLATKINGTKLANVTTSTLFSSCGNERVSDCWQLGCVSFVFHHVGVKFVSDQWVPDCIQIDISRSFIELDTHEITAPLIINTYKKGMCEGGDTTLPPSPFLLRSHAAYYHSAPLSQ